MASKNKIYKLEIRWNSLAGRTLGTHKVLGKTFTCSHCWHIRVNIGWGNIRSRLQMWCAPWRWILARLPVDIPQASKHFLGFTRSSSPNTDMWSTLLPSNISLLEIPWVNLFLIGFKRSFSPILVCDLAKFHDLARLSVDTFWTSLGSTMSMFHWLHFVIKIQMFLFTYKNHQLVLTRG